jgi:hypothetical protein
VRIEWLNAEMTEARITRGRLWWKRVAFVQRKAEGVVINKGYTNEHTINWLFTDANRWCDRALDAQLDRRRNDERTWKRPGQLPRAEVMR